MDKEYDLLIKKENLEPKRTQLTIKVHILIGGSPCVIFSRIIL